LDRKDKMCIINTNKQEKLIMSTRRKRRTFTPELKKQIVDL